MTEVLMVSCASSRASEMKTKLQIRVQSSRVLVAVVATALGEVSYVCPGESFHDLDFSYLSGLGDGVHEVECDLRKPSLRMRVDCAPGVPVSDELGWLEFCWDVSLLTTNETALRVLSLCAEKGPSQVVSVVPEPLRAALRDFVLEIPLEPEGGFIGYPEITREVIVEVLSRLEPGT